MTACTERHTTAPDDGLAGEGQKGMAKGGSVMTTDRTGDTAVNDRERCGHDGPPGGPPTVGP